LLKARKRAAFVAAVLPKSNATPSFEKSLMASNYEVAMEPKRRKLVWGEKPRFQGWVCTECAWVFNPSWPLVGKTIDEMKTDFGQQRDRSSHLIFVASTRER
jgi:hypothetical protein